MTRREKPADSRWLIEQRKRRGWNPADVAQRVDVAETTVRGWESGRAIGADARIRLEAVFGTPAPGSVPPPSAQAVDLTPIVEAINRQTDALERRTKALDREAKITEALIANVGRRLDLMEKAQEQRFLALTEALADLLRPPTTDAGAGTGPGGEPTHPGSGRIRVATGQ